MYDRVVDDQELTFVVSGKLWNRSLVMQDVETSTLWSHILGAAMEGQLVDTKLTVIPSLITDWETWKTLHPKSTVVLMTRTSGHYTREYSSGQLSRFMVGLEGSQSTRGWNFEELRKQPLVNDEFEGQPVVVYFNEKSMTSFLYSREIGDKVLEFAIRDNKLIDLSTQSEWDLEAGVCLDGELAGSRLTRLPSIPTYVVAWNTFHPNSEFWEPQSERSVQNKPAN